MKTCKFWLKCFIIFILICIWILSVTIKPNQQQVDISKKNLNEKMDKVILELDFLHTKNAELNHQILILTQRLRIIENSEFWYYVNSELLLLAKTVVSIKPITIRIKKNINEQYLSLLNDITKLETVDDHTKWRREEYIYLRTLVQKRLRFLQNPEDCSKAKKLFCNLISVCRLTYEMMNGIKNADASSLFTSLDDVYNFSDRIRRLHVAVLPHKSNRPQEMDLQVGDEIEFIGNEQNGYSKGTHLRTNKTLLYPTFKVIKKIEVMYFARRQLLRYQNKP